MSIKREDLIPNDDIDKMVHEPARLKIMLYLYSVDVADFVYLMHKTGLSKGNLSSHLSKLEEAEYVNIEKTFVEKIPKTLINITQKGEKAFQNYKTTLFSYLNSVK